MDLIFIVGSVLSGRDDLETRTLLRPPEIMLFSRNNPLAACAGLTSNDFSQQEFLFVSDEVLTPEMVRCQVRAMEKRYGFTMRTHLLRNTDELVLALELDEGVALMDDWSRYKISALLTFIPVNLTIPVVLVWKKNSSPPVLTTFAQETALFFQENRSRLTPPEARC